MKDCVQKQLQKSLFWLIVLEGKSPLWQRGIVAGGRREGKGRMLRNHISNQKQEADSKLEVKL